MVAAVEPAAITLVSSAVSDNGVIASREASDITCHDRLSHYWRVWRLPAPRRSTCIYADVPRSIASLLLHLIVILKKARILYTFWNYPETDQHDGQKIHHSPLTVPRSSRGAVISPLPHGCRSAALEASSGSSSRVASCKVLSRAHLCAARGVPSIAACGRELHHRHPYDRRARPPHALHKRCRLSKCPISR